MKTEAASIAQTRTAVAVEADLRGIVLALFLGLGLIFAAGFSQASVMHDVGHDTRHAAAFPCH